MDEKNFDETYQKIKKKYNFFPTGRFISSKKFCTLVNSKTVRKELESDTTNRINITSPLKPISEKEETFLYFNLGTSLLGTNFAEGVTISNSLEFLEIVLFYISRFIVLKKKRNEPTYDVNDYNIELYSELININTITDNYLIGRDNETFFNSNLENILNKFYYFYISDLFDLEFLIDNNEPSKICYDNIYQLDTRIIHLCKDDDIDDDIDEDIDDEDTINKCFNEKYNFNESSFESMNNKFNSIDVNNELVLDHNFKFCEDTLDIFIFGLGPIGLLTAVYFIQLSVIYEYPIRILCIENRINRQGKRKEFNRNNSVNIPEGFFPKKSWMKKIVGSKLVKIKNLQDNLIRFLHTYKNPLINVKFRYYKYKNFEIFKKQLKEKNYKLDKSFIFNCTSYVDIFDLGLDIEKDIQTHLIEKEKIEFCLNKKIYIVGDTNYFCINLKDIKKEILNLYPQETKYAQVIHNQAEKYYCINLHKKNLSFKTKQLIFLGGTKKKIYKFTRKKNRKNILSQKRRKKIKFQN